MRVNVRFNTDYPSKSQFAWRVISDGKETLVNDVRFEIPCFTTAEFIEGLGMKYHLSADADNVEIQLSVFGGFSSITMLYNTRSAYCSNATQTKIIAIIK